MYFVLLSRNNPLMLKWLKSVYLRIINSNESLPAKMEKIYGMQIWVGLQLFWSGTPTFSNGTPTFCQMGVLNSCFQNPSESSALDGEGVRTRLHWEVMIRLLWLLV